MKKFMGEDFLLSTPSGVFLYENFAKDLPIIDYHCHINPKEIAEDKSFQSITEAWLYGDHYKWRAIRACGYDEKYITGDASDYERFKAWAATMPNLVGNPLFHWTHLELKRYFGYDGILNEKTCDEVFNRCNKLLQSKDMSVKSIIKNSNVEIICTTDDPADSLEYHGIIRLDSSFKTRVLPAMRPDKGVNIDKPGFAEYIKTKLGPAAEIEICDLDSLKQAFVKRIDFFEQNGCLTSDHGLDYVVYSPASDSEVNAILKKALCKESISKQEADKYKTYLLCFFAQEFSKRDWVMQFHYGALRNLSTNNFNRIGPDTGYDAIAGYDCIRSAASLLDCFEQKAIMPKCIFYSLNPIENAAIDAMCGCFQANDKGIRSRIQHGSAWWFNDNLEGMRDQLKTLAGIGVLGNFVGMLTDSRSFLSYTRHEYFRRILCDYIGGLMDRGEYPADLETAGAIVKNICHDNAARYFGFEK